MSTILVVDDKASARKILQQKLGKNGYNVLEAEDEDLAADLLRNNSIDLILTDVRMKQHDSGVELLKIAKKDYPNLPVILMTAYGTIPQAVQAIRDGAEDYIERPYNIDALMVKMERALQKRQLIEENKFLVEENRFLRDELHLRGDFTDIIGKSKKLQDVLEVVRKVAKSDSSVLIRGESGTGKELIAQAIHNNSARRDKAFIRADCAIYAEGVLESELFGHEKGAFTNAIRGRMGRFELAHGGTIFLDEIGDISPQTQLKLLRVLQDKTFERVGGSRPITVDVRIIAATNKNLENAIQKGTFRQDLYYRINVVPVDLPPLRERREDIPDLVHHFIRKLAGKISNKVKHVSPEAMELMINYEWRGNIRELEHAIERAMVFADGDTILPEHLPLPTEVIMSQDIPKAGTLEEVEKLEKRLILEALQHSNWIRTKAASMLGIKRSTLNYKMEKHSISSPVDESNE
jgi:DNA-binding NtrC family response regulator